MGALPRLKRSQRVTDAVVMGVGLAILANSRPYEGFVFSLPVAGALFAWMLGKHRPHVNVALRCIVMPLCLVLAFTAVAMGYYCWRVTGSPFRMPYQVEREAYAVAPYILWQSARPQPVYHHDLVHQMYAVDELRTYSFERSLLGCIAMPLFRGAWTWSFYVGPVLTVPLLIAAFTVRRNSAARRPRKGTRFLLFACGLMLLGLALETFYAPHYASPMTGVILGLVLLGMREMQRGRWWGKPTGLFLVRSIPLICVTMFVLRSVAAPLHVPITEYYARAWHQAGPASFGRRALLEQLQSIRGGHLVIVRYGPSHDIFDEWVYNDADIDAAKVVWARDMSPRENEELIHYFKGREIWLLEADEKPPRLTPYPRESTLIPATGADHLGSAKLP